MNKQETAQVRFQELYLYSDRFAMSQKDFVLKKAEIEQEIASLKIKLSENDGADNVANKTDGSEFLNGMILFKKMMLDPGQPHDYEDLIK